jgi:hypothetical protein
MYPVVADQHGLGLTIGQLALGQCAEQLTSILDGTCLVAGEAVVLSTSADRRRTASPKGPERTARLVGEIVAVPTED